MTHRWAKKIFCFILMIGFAWEVNVAAPGNTSEGNMLVTRSALGAWMLRESPATPRLNCAVRFVPSREKQPGFAIMGPTNDSSSAVILFNGADIPSSNSIEEVQVELVQQGLPATRMRATQLPRQQGEGLLAIAAGDIRQTINSMRDSERNMQLWMNGATVATLDYDGLALARSAMLACLDGKRFAGKTLKEATAELRPLGNSVIKGQAYFKPALLASKKYPPKGSRAVGLIWMTPEFKAWHEQVKREKKMPASIPESIAKHFMSTTILDDKGGFSFTNMPAGEYLLIADFSYEQTVNQEEVIGRTDVYVGGNYVGSNNQITVGTYSFQQGLTFEKPVVVPEDGKVVEVTLDKSQIMCFLVCF